MQAGRAGQRAAKLTLLDGDRDRLAAPVEHAGDDALLRRRRVSREPRCSRVVTISFVRSPAIPAAECSGDRLEPAVSRGVRGAAPRLGRRGGGDPLRRARAAPGSSSASTRRRSARPAAARGCGSTTTPADGLADAMRLSQAMTREDGGRERRPRRRQGGARRAGAADGRGPPRAAAPLRRARHLARRHVSHRRRHEHHARRSRRRRASAARGCTGRPARGGNSGRGTALGVLHGIRASVEHVFGSPDLAGRTRARAGRRRRSATTSRASSPAEGARRARLRRRRGARRSRRVGGDVVAARRRARRPSATSTRRAPSAAR